MNVRQRVDKLEQQTTGAPPGFRVLEQQRDEPTLYEDKLTGEIMTRAEAPARFENIMWVVYEQPHPFATITVIEHVDE